MSDSPPPSWYEPPPIDCCAHPAACPVDEGTSREHCGCSCDHNREPDEDASATPEGKPSAREIAHEHATNGLGYDWCHNERPHTAEGPHSYFCDRLTAAIAARDALHAETLATTRDENARLATALQHGEERERKLREALDAIRDAGPCECGPVNHDGDVIGEHGACYVGIADRALATAQAMKEGTNG